MISLNEILDLHSRSIKDYGGSVGVRDIQLLASAVTRPYQSFGGKDLYPTVFEKAAALGQSLINNHPFVDGNKRIGTLAMVSLIHEDGYKMTASPEDLYTLLFRFPPIQFRSKKW